MKFSMITKIGLARILFGGALALMIGVMDSAHVSGQQTNRCGMQLNQAPVVFCDTFDAPSPVTNRSGQLNGVLWGVSRLSGGGFGWSPSTLVGCNGDQPAQPDATDIIICNGQLRESTNDNGDVTTLAMYPKQPFNFAGRTGTISFDVTNDTSGTHGAWPEFWLTDQPVPAPFTHSAPCDMCSVPRNSIGIRFAGVFDPFQGPQANGCPSDGNRRWIVESMVISRNYATQDLTWLGGNGWQQLGCAIAASGPNGALNHIEIRLSQSQVEVWATDPGSTQLKILTRVSNLNLTFTQGLVWIQDSHYNAHKSPIPSHSIHTFKWDNVAFDGPATYRDLSFDVLDRLNPFNGLFELGWQTGPTAPANLNTLPMTSQNISAATSALLMFNYGFGTNPTTFNYTINGNANSAPNPVPYNIFGWRSIALPVPLSQLVAGPQNIRLSSNQAMSISNVNIVLVAAAPVPGTNINPPTAPTNLKILR